MFITVTVYGDINLNSRDINMDRVDWYEETKPGLPGTLLVFDGGTRTLRVNETLEQIRNQMDAVRYEQFRHYWIARGAAGGNS